MFEHLRGPLLAAKHLTFEAVRRVHSELADALHALARAGELERFAATLDVPDALRAKIAALDLSTPSGDVVEQLRVSLGALGVEETLVVRIVERAREKKLGRSTHPKATVGADPAVAKAIATAHLHDVATIARLDAPVAAAVAKAVRAPSAIDDAALSKLVADRTLTEAQAKDLGLGATLYTLSGENTALATAMRDASFPSLGGKPAASTQEFARASISDWTAALASFGADAPAMARGLSARFALLHPNVALSSRLPSADASRDALVRAYPGLGLDTVLDDPQRPAQAKSVEASRRIALVKTALDALGDRRLLSVNLAADSPDLAALALPTGDANADDRRAVLATLRGHQRALSLAPNVDDAVALLGAGFASGVSVARLSLDDFRARTDGLSSTTAQSVWQNARSAMADVSLSTTAMLDAMHGSFDAVSVANQPPSSKDYLASLPGFQDLFGSLSFCDCEECRSVLGPAAYFVDLMKFIDENLRTAFTHAGNPIDLKTRRPDLWTLVLSCDNTDQRIPTLEIVNEVLENWIAQHRLGYTGSLDDRTEIGRRVYGVELASSIDSFRQPFHLPLVRVLAYAQALGVTRTSVAGAIGAPTDVRTRAELGASTDELGVLASASKDLATLGRLYDLPFTGSAAKVDRVDAQPLAAAMGLSRAELGDVVATTFVSAGGAHPSITPTKRDAASVQNDVEWVDGLDVDALDRMHRFTRLTRKLGLSFGDVDLLLTTLGIISLIATDLDAIADVRAANARLHVSVPELCALVGDLPRTPAGSSLFDRAFNSPAFVAADGPFPKPTTHFVHPALRHATASTPDPALQRLLVGLGVDQDELLTLVRRLSPHLAGETAKGFDPDAPKDDDRYFALSAPNLTLLYRHARLARLLDLSIDELFLELALLGNDHVASRDDLRVLLDLDAWRREAGFTVDDLAVATGRPPGDLAVYADPAAIAARVVASAATALSFTETIFAAAIGTTEQGSRDLLAANRPSLVEPTSNGGWRLTAGVDLDAVAITIPPSAVVSTPPAGTRPVTADEVRDALRPHAVREFLVRALGAELGRTTDQVVALVALARLSADADDVARAVRGEGPIAPLVALVAALRPLVVALVAPAWDSTAIDFLRTHAKLFTTEDLPRKAPDALHPTAPFVTLDQLRALSAYARLVGSDVAAGGERVRAALATFDGAHEFPPGSDALVALALDAAAGLVAGLRGRFPLPDTAAAALDRLDRAVSLASTLGVDGASFVALLSDDDDALSHAADAITAAFGSRYADEATRSAKLEEVEQPVREARRDALADYLIHSVTPKHWSTFDELYEYFLVDVRAGGCSTTSRLVSATMTAQLYVQRAIMNLERSPSTDTAPIVVTLPPEALREWAWRKNYRVWQANRKVFLWPENYLEPDLRDDKTPLFEELEQALLQTDIDDQNVLDAYTTYLAGFEEIGSLVIAGAYHDVRKRGAVAAGEVGDVLHLFGATSDDPPTYYHRTCENLIASGTASRPPAVWTPWRKLSVQITGRRVSPVVHKGRLCVFWIDVKTRPLNQVRDGASTFVGYRHKMSLKLTTLRQDGTWSPPQDIALPDTDEFGPGRGQVNDDLVGGATTLDPEGRTQTEPLDDYTLSGSNWDWAWPRSDPSSGKLQLRLRDFMQGVDVDLFAKKTSPVAEAPPATPYPQLLCAKPAGSAKQLWYGTSSYVPWGSAAWANLLVDDDRVRTMKLELDLTDFESELAAGPIATIPSDTQLLAVPGSEDDVLLQVGSDVLMLQGSFHDDGRYLLRRLGSTLVEPLARKLFEDGIDAVLDTQNQLGLMEAGVPFTLAAGDRVDPDAFDGPVAGSSGTVDFSGPSGSYYREIFFHIPFLIATSLNARGRFESAQRWYHYLFDPTSSEKIDVSGVSPGDKARRLLDRVWRYREFRNLGVEHLRDLLTDAGTLDLYRKDPFNPWAIARRRISAFQKAIVMRYVDNLLDWADALFTQFTMESVNEAMMLYIMASDVLGPRPTALGDCGAQIEPNDYATIAPLVEGTSEVFAEIETWILGARATPAAAPSDETSKYVMPRAHVVHAVEGSALIESSTASGASPASGAIYRGQATNELRTSSWGPALGGSAERTADPVGGRITDHASKLAFAPWAARFGWGLVRQLSPVFCVPVNAQLLAYWDRIADRLYKIRNCMDIDGEHRELALFAPPIDPLQLEAMTAAGLALEDVLGAGNGDLPPYRFLYLVERAKAFASALAGFGTALLSSLERKDGEQLNRLRLTQQTNLARQTTQIRQMEIDAAAASLDALTRQQESAQARRDFYDGLLSDGRNAWESRESLARHTASGLLVREAAAQSLAAALTLAPQVGSALAMKYGGVEVGGSAYRFGSALASLADASSAVAASAGLEASFTRRTEVWRQQRDLAADDVKVLDRQIAAARIRLDIANRSLALHQKSIDQLQEMLDLTDGKFTNLGLYTWLAEQLRREQRSAYQNAMALAKLAERAYRFERGDDASPPIVSPHWDPTRGGLLAGEQLLVDLQTLERRFLETNHRTLEIDQAFALSQVDPRALVALRETGECAFEIGEAFFDLFYPGHYKRRIKAVRLTLPCVTGPYVNVSATLALENSRIRATPDAGGSLVDVPPSRSIAIATSTAQNDSGVFELSFRDERYMPFEGLGAVSRWRLTLPKTFRPFDYQTLNDVIVSIAYTAEQDGALRDRVEKDNAALEGTLVRELTERSTARLLSLRQDFSSAFTRLLRSPLSTTVKLEIGERNLPWFVRGRKLRIEKAMLALRLAPGASSSGFALAVDGAPVTAFAPDATLAGLPVAPMPAALLTSALGPHTLAVDSAGSLAPSSPLPGDVSTIDPDRLLDVLVLLEYRLA
jgi:hypothetical protein